MVKRRQSRSRSLLSKLLGTKSGLPGRPADKLSPELDNIREKCKQYIEQDEDVLSYALFGQVATKFFEFRQAQKYGVDYAHAERLIRFILFRIKERSGSGNPFPGSLF